MRTCVCTRSALCVQHRHYVLIKSTKTRRSRLASDWLSVISHCTTRPYIFSTLEWRKNCKRKIKIKGLDQGFDLGWGQSNTKKLNYCWCPFLGRIGKGKMRTIVSASYYGYKPTHMWYHCDCQKQENFYCEFFGSNQL